MDPLVSILIPAYNSAPWIRYAIESALAQTWSKTEIIIVNDGSTDATLEIAKRFASKRVQVLTQTNQGAAAARNVAFARSQGDYIQWLDADDLLDREKVERQVRQIPDCPSARALLSGAWASFMHRVRKAEFVPTRLWADLTPMDWLLRKMGENLQMQTDNWLVSRELTTAAGPWDARLWRDNDGEYFCRVVLASDGIRFVPEARSYYRIRGFNSVSHIGDSHRKLESLFLSMTLHVHYLRSLEDSARTRAACLNYIRTWLHAFHPYRLDLADRLKCLAREMGEELAEPRLPWKYDWIVRLFGWNAGRRAHILMPKLKQSTLVAWDQAMFRLEDLMAHECRAPVDDELEVRR